VLTEVTLDLRVYSLLTVQRAAAALSAEYIAALARSDDTHVRVSLRPRFDADSQSEAVADLLALLTDLSLQDARDKDVTHPAAEPPRPDTAPRAAPR
jgi:hypothetical protein